MVLEALLEAPSSEVEAPDFDSDPARLGERMLMTTRERGGHLLLGELDDRVVGVAQAIAREFGRARHVLDTALLVHPAGRRQGVGTALLGELIEVCARSQAAAKLAARVAQDDPVLRRLLEARGFTLERVERGGLERDGERHDILVFGLLLPSALGARPGLPEIP
jgi:GNAT superfamily N-acetyltransferase